MRHFALTCLGVLSAISAGSVAIAADPVAALKIIAGQLIDGPSVGESERVDYYVPKGFDPEAKHPLIFVISANAPLETRPVFLREYFAMRAKADIDGTVLVYLSLQERDLQEIRSNAALIERLYDRFTAGMNIDRDRVYVTGESGGGYMTFLMSCRMPEKLAAIAPSLHAVDTALLGSCERAAPLPVMIISGTADPGVPFEGASWPGEPAEWDDVRLLSAGEYVQYWRARNRLRSAPVETALDDPVTEVTRGKEIPSHIIRYSWTSEDGNDLVWLKVVGGGHMLPVWAGGKAADNSHNLDAETMAYIRSLGFDGPPDRGDTLNSDFDARGAIYDFLLSHSRRGRE